MLAEVGLRCQMSKLEDVHDQTGSRGGGLGLSIASPSDHEGLEADSALGINKWVNARAELHEPLGLFRGAEGPGLAEEVEQPPLVHVARAGGVDVQPNVAEGGKLLGVDAQKCQVVFADPI